MALVGNMTIGGMTPFKGSIVNTSITIRVGNMPLSADSFFMAPCCGMQAEPSGLSVHGGFFAASRTGGSGSGARSAQGPRRPTPPSGGGGSGGDPKLKGHFKTILERTSTPEKELDLLEDAITGGEDGFRWMEMVRRAVAGDADFSELMARPLARKLFDMTRSVLAPLPDNFTSEERTPWGGTLIPRMKKGLGKWGKDLVVGESWEISGHPKFPNRFALSYAGKRTTIEIRQLEAMFSNNLYGGFAPANEVISMPFLVKLLNSGGWEEYKGELAVILTELDEKKEAAGLRKQLGLHASLVELVGRNNDEIHQGILNIENRADGDYPEIAELRALHRHMLTKNLSVQVHPDSDFKGLKPGEHSKTEAWIIIGAEDGAGIYLGLKEGVTKEQFAAALNSGDDVTRFHNFVPVYADDVFFIPAGTIHAIGAGVILVEPQETSETTYRVFDYGRLDDKGRPRQLHVEQAIAATIWDGPRGQDAISKLRRMPETVPSSGENAQIVERLFDEDFARSERLTLTKDEVFSGEGGAFRGYMVIDGGVSVIKGKDNSIQGEFMRGQSFIVPAAMGDFIIKNSSNRAVLIETSAVR